MRQLQWGAVFYNICLSSRWFLLVYVIDSNINKSLNAAHHKRQRSILGISWKNRITNVQVRNRNGQQTVDNILRERRPHWLGYVCRMDHQRNTTASTVLAGTRIQERTRSTKSKLEERTKHGVHLGGSRGGSSWLTQMASECGPMCPMRDESRSRSRPKLIILGIYNLQTCKHNTLSILPPMQF